MGAAAEGWDGDKGLRGADRHGPARHPEPPANKDGTGLGPKEAWNDERAPAPIPFPSPFPSPRGRPVGGERGRGAAAPGAAAQRRVRRRSLPSLALFLLI